MNGNLKENGREKDDEVLDKCLTDVRVNSLEFLYLHHPEIRYIIHVIIQCALNDAWMDKKKMYESIIFNCYKMMRK